MLGLLIPYEVCVCTLRKEKLIEAITSILGGDGTIHLGQYYDVPCAAKNTTGTLNYQFGNVTISAPLADSILEQGGICGLAATSTSGSRVPVNILGDPFLRSAYVVYDQDNS